MVRRDHSSRRATLPVSAVPARRLLLGADFCLAASAGVIFPLLPELQEKLGFSTAALGLISSAAFLAAIAGQLLLARLADRGHTKALLVTGLVLAAGALLWFASAHRLADLVAARVVGGLAFGTFGPAARGLFATADPARTGANLARLTGVETLGFTLGPALGALLNRLGGLHAPFVVLAVLAAGLAVGVALRCPPIPSRTADDAEPTPLIAFDLLRLRPVRIAAALSVMLFLPIGMYDALWARYLTDRGASALFVGLTLSLYGVPFALFTGPGGRVIDRLGSVRAATTAVWVIVPVTVLYGLLPWPEAIVALALVEAAANAVAMPAAQAAMAEACPRERVAAGQGLAGALTQIVAAVVALLAAPAYGAAGSGPVFTTAAACIAALAIVAARRHRRLAASPLAPAT